MSIEVLQQRLADLKFSLEESVKALQKEQDDSEQEHQEWEEQANEEEQVDEPDVIDNDARINACEAAKNKINEAIEALDAALED